MPYAPSMAFNKSINLLHARSISYGKSIQLVLAVKNFFITEDIAMIFIYVTDDDIVSHPNAFQARTK